jgi:hypothetical protein
MIIPIKTSPEKLYIKAFLVLKHLPPFNTLRARELQLLGWLVYYYNKFFKEHNSDVIANKLTFDYDIRIKICSAMDIEMKNLYTLIMGLKKAGILEKNSINLSYRLNENNLKEITYKFEISE